MPNSKVRDYVSARNRGDRVQATVLSTHSYGCVLRLADDITALLELVEIASVVPLKETDLPQPGDTLEVHLNAYDSVRDQLYVTLRELDWDTELAPRNRIPPE